jgi:hypothetical protein
MSAAAAGVASTSRLADTRRYFLIAVLMTVPDFDKRRAF